MIKFVDGDFFDFDADIRINTVNCVGVMGAGVAFAFKNKYPEMYDDYVQLCKNGKISPGKPAVWRSRNEQGKNIEIINFPTKDHWRNKSKYEYIEQGLAWLSSYLNNMNGKIITLPALGCGHGGLDWAVVKEMIKNALSDNQNEILVFSPQASKSNNREGIKHNHFFPTLKQLNITEIRCDDKIFPKRLSHFSNKSLFYTGDFFTNFDLSIISSTSPNDTEKNAVLNILRVSADKGYSILFGGSAFDKRMAVTALRMGIKTGVFLPNGLAKSAEKMNDYGQLNNFTILSLGDPFVQYNKIDYLPAVLSRILLPRKALFTTNKLQWIKKYKKLIIQNQVESFFLISDASDNDIEAAYTINSKAIDEQGIISLI